MADFAEGFPRFALGLTKKVVIAILWAEWLPSLSPCQATRVRYRVDRCPSVHRSDLLRLLGLFRHGDRPGAHFRVPLPREFRSPLSSVSMTDFWRRWHMTLSRWFRDYVYMPLGESRGSRGQTIRNLWFVFLLTGAWHGAAWTFIIWGVYNGTLVVFERLRGSRLWMTGGWS